MVSWPIRYPGNPSDGPRCFVASGQFPKPKGTDKKEQIDAYASPGADGVGEQYPNPLTGWLEPLAISEEEQRLLRELNRLKLRTVAPEQRIESYRKLYSQFGELFPKTMVRFIACPLLALMPSSTDKMSSFRKMFLQLISDLRALDADGICHRQFMNALDDAIGDGLAQADYYGGMTSWGRIRWVFGQPAKPEIRALTDFSWQLTDALLALLEGDIARKQSKLRVKELQYRYDGRFNGVDLELIEDTARQAILAAPVRLLRELTSLVRQSPAMPELFSRIDHFPQIATDLVSRMEQWDYLDWTAAVVDYLSRKALFVGATAMIGGLTSSTAVIGTPANSSAVELALGNRSLVMGGFKPVPAPQWSWVPWDQLIAPSMKTPELWLNPFKPLDSAIADSWLDWIGPGERRTMPPMVGGIADYPQLRERMLTTHPLAGLMSEPAVDRGQAIRAVAELTLTADLKNDHNTLFGAAAVFGAERVARAAVEAIELGSQHSERWYMASIKIRFNRAVTSDCRIVAEIPAGATPGQAFDVNAVIGDGDATFDATILPWPERTIFSQDRSSDSLILDPAVGGLSATVLEKMPLATKFVSRLGTIAEGSGRALAVEGVVSKRPADESLPTALAVVGGWGTTYQAQRTLGIEGTILISSIQLQLDGPVLGYQIVAVCSPLDEFGLKRMTQAATDALISARGIPVKLHGVIWVDGYRLGRFRAGYVIVPR